MISTIEFWISILPQLLNGFRLSLAVTGVSLLLGIPLGCSSPYPCARARHGLKLLCLRSSRSGAALRSWSCCSSSTSGFPRPASCFRAFGAVVAAFTWSTAAYTSEIIRAGLEAVPQGQREASEALRLSRIDALRYIILPQGLPVSVPAPLGFSILMLQASSLAFVALPELMSKANLIESNTFRYMEIFTLVAAIYAAVCVPATLLVGYLERRFSRHI